MNSFLNHHHAALLLALKRLWATPFNTALSLLAISITLALPALGYVVLDNLRALGGNLSGVQQISLFMEVSAQRKDVAEIEKRLAGLSTVKFVLVPREEALDQLRHRAGMAEIVASLPRNPLPDAFIVEAVDGDPMILERLREEFASWPKVAHVQLDSAWVKRFDAFLRLGKLGVALLAALFAAGLIAVTFNTIRLQVLGRAAEIEVARMIGATDAFIRRPFQYYGALQGAAGGILAAGIVFLALALARAPVEALTSLYGGSFALRLPGGLEVSLLVLIGAFLGWLGAQLSVALSLRQFD